MKCNKRSVIYRNVEERQNSANFQWWVGSLSLSKLLNNKNTAVKLFIYQGKMFHDYSKISKSLHFMTCVISNPVRKYFLALSGPIIIRKKEVQFMSALSRGCCHTPACGHRDMLLLQLQRRRPATESFWWYFQLPTAANYLNLVTPASKHFYFPF